MNSTKILYIVLALNLLTCKGLKKDTKTTQIKNATKTLITVLNPKSGTLVKGDIVFTEKGGIVNMTAKISGLSPGIHAIHLHEVSDCSSEDGKSAGGHWNPTAQPHGKWGDSAGYHKGDIGNFTADENGNGIITFSTNEWCLGCNDKNKDILGKSVIVHAGTDDYTSQPAGNAGARVSCAGIIE